MSDDPNSPPPPESADAEPSLVSRLKREIDELLLQLDLGKADAVDFVEKQKGELRTLVDHARQGLDEGRIAAGDQARSLKQQLDELRLQLALGKMESRDALGEQRAKIVSAIDSTRDSLEPLEEKAKSTLRDGGESLKTKLDALALDLGIRAAVAEEELARTKDSFKEELHGIKATLQPAIDGVGESVDEIARQAGEKFKDFKNRLSQLFD